MKKIYHYSTKLNIRFTDFDSYQVAHNSKYFVWFEECRLKFIQKYDVQGIWKQYHFLLIGANIEYKRPVVYDGNYMIQMVMTMDELMPKLFFEYLIIDIKTKKVCTKGTTTHIIANNENRLCITIPEDLRDVLFESELVTGVTG